MRYGRRYGYSLTVQIGSAPPVSMWILTTGSWNDAGLWDDSAVWID